MPLTKEDIRRKSEEYFTSEIARDPAYISYDGEDFEDYTESKCVYKATDGRKCAVGCLIPETKYDERWDSGTGIGITGLPETIKSYLGVENIETLADMQRHHDEIAGEWHTGLYEKKESHFGKFLLGIYRQRFTEIFSK